MEIYPIKLSAALKDYIWGGRKLKEKYGKHTDAVRVAESWEVSCHPDGACRAVNGPLAGRTLAEILTEHPQWKGTACDRFEFFPIIVKLIDAAQNLSVQVHPSDDYALANEGQYGKTEMWYVAEAEEGAGVYCGFREQIVPETLKAALEKGEILEKLAFLPVKKGDCIFIPSGTVHAICGGLVVCEVQQNSALTYRLYDYGRTGPDGKPRALHIEKALAVTDRAAIGLLNAGVERLDEKTRLLARCDYFLVKEIVADGAADVRVPERSFLTLTVTAGSGVLRYADVCYPLQCGDTYFLPAGAENAAIEGGATVITAEIPFGERETR